MRALFGDLCYDGTGGTFAWDDAMRAAKMHLQERDLMTKRKRDSESGSPRSEGPQAVQEIGPAERSGACEGQTTSKHTRVKKVVNIATKTVPIPTQSAIDRLRARKEAFEAAVEGRWSEVRLASITQPAAESDEEL